MSSDSGDTPQMVAHLALRGTLAGVPITLAGDINAPDPTYVAVAKGLRLDINGFLRELLRPVGAPVPENLFPRVNLDALYIMYRKKADGSGWFGLSAQTTSSDLFFVHKLAGKQPAEGKSSHAFGMQAAFAIGSLPLVDQYPELRDIGILKLGFLHASDGGSYEIPYIQEDKPDGAQPALGSSPPLELKQGGFYGWVALYLKSGDPLILRFPPPEQDSKATPGPAAALQLAAETQGDQDAGAAGKSAVSWKEINKTFGPITLAKVGIAYSDGKVTFLVNASLAAAGLTLTLLGLGVRSAISPIQPQPLLHGISITYRRGPLELSGGLLASEDFQTFAGEVLIRTKKFGLSAFGAYSNVPEDKTSNKPAYKSLFVFGMLEVPLGGPPAFFVTGLAAGFGYHSKLNLPPVAKLNDFLLVKGALPPATDRNPLADKRQDPGAILATLMEAKDVEADAGETWLAAGIRFTSFQMVQSFALLTVSFGTQFEIALLGRSQISVPPAEGIPIAFAEVDLKAVIRLDATGLKPVLAVDGIVAAGSYVFSRTCALTGGFAFYIWESGEFVITFGGYHPRFRVPDHYPKPGRLGFVWPVTDSLNCKGALYFALTGAAIMAGFRLQATYQSGPVSASFIAQVDFLLAWKPFFYEARARVHLSVNLHRDLGLFTASVYFQLDVSVYLHGPPFGGVAHVDLGLFSFSIPFGADTLVKPPALRWQEFAGAFLPPDNAVWAGVTGGLVRESKADGWIINPRDFEITTHTAVPATEALVNTKPVLAGTPIGIRPMGANSVTSSHRIRLEKRGTDNEWAPYEAADERLAFEPVTGQSPKALYNNGQQSAGALLTQPAMIDDTLLGVRIRPTVQQPDRTQAVPIEALLLGSGEAQGYRGFAGPARSVMAGATSLDKPPDQTLPRDSALWEAFAGQFAGLQAWLEGA